MHIINELKRMKNKALAKKVELAATPVSKMQFGFFSEPPYIEVSMNLPEFKNTEIPSVDILKAGKSPVFYKRLDEMHENFDGRLEKITQVYIGVVEAILADASNQYAELVNELKKEPNEESD